MISQLVCMRGLFLAISISAASLTQADRLSSAQLTIAGSTIDVTFAPGQLTLSRTQVLHWTTASAYAVANYYGHFPVPRLRVLLTPTTGDDVRSGTTYGGRVPLIKVALGSAAGEEALKKDWVMTHEMVHLAFPRVPDVHHWIEEGIATYVEPWARFGTGQLKEETVWRDLVQGLPHGLPGLGDRGLDYTPTWGRTYWGGALFCLLADLEIRQRTANRYGLQNALRAIVAASGTMQVMWPLIRAFEAGDQATGVSVLTDLYDRMKATPVDVDLANLWQRLGVEVRGDTVVFHDDAPLAPVRRAIAEAARAKAERVGKKTQKTA